MKKPRFRYFQTKMVAELWFDITNKQAVNQAKKGGARSLSKRIDAEEKSLLKDAVSTELNSKKDWLLVSGTEL